MAEFNFGTARPLATQRVIQYVIHVPTDRTVQLSEDLDPSRLISTFLISNYSTAPASIYLGTDPHLPTAIEIAPGACPSFIAFQEGRQMYEIQVLLRQLTHQTATDLVKIPIIVWDMREWYLMAGGSTTIDAHIMAFPLPYL